MTIPLAKPLTMLSHSYIAVGLLFTLFVHSLIMASHQKELRIVSWNCNGISSKSHELELLINNPSPDIFCLTETKLEPSIADNEIVKNYTIYRQDRTTGPGHGGGVLIGLSNKCPFIVSRINNCCSGEIIVLDLSVCGFSFTLACYYRGLQSNRLMILLTGILTKHVLI